MHFYRLPCWVSETICKLFPRRYGYRLSTFVHSRRCRPRQSIQPCLDPFESRESPTALLGPNPLASIIGISAMTTLAADARSALANESWQSPIADSWSVSGDSKPQTSEVTNSSEVSVSASPQGTDAPRSEENQNLASNWIAFSPGEFFPHQFPPDFPLLAHPNFGGSSSAAAADSANLRSFGSDGGSSFGVGAGSWPGLSQGGGPGFLSSSGLNWNPLSGLAPAAGAGGVSPVSQPNSSGLPANGIVPIAPGTNATPLAPPVAHAPGSDLAPSPLLSLAPSPANPNPNANPNGSPPPIPTTPLPPDIIPDLTICAEG
jgi:hypothetical protein